MTTDDIFACKLTLFREAEGEGLAGQRAVLWAIRNRSIKRDISPYRVCTARLQFSGMTAPGNPRTTVWPDEGNPIWTAIGRLVDEVFGAPLAMDPVHGATMYYNPGGLLAGDKASAGFKVPGSAAGLVAWPRGWGDQSRYKFQVQIGGHLFFTEVG